VHQVPPRLHAQHHPAHSSTSDPVAGSIDVPRDRGLQAAAGQARGARHQPFGPRARRAVHHRRAPHGAGRDAGALFSPSTASAARSTRTSGVKGREDGPHDSLALRETRRVTHAMLQASTRSFVDLQTWACASTPTNPPWPTCWRRPRSASWGGGARRPNPVNGWQIEGPMPARRWWGGCRTWPCPSATASRWASCAALQRGGPHRASLTWCDGQLAPRHWFDDRARLGEPVAEHPPTSRRPRCTGHRAIEYSTSRGRGTTSLRALARRGGRRRLAASSTARCRASASTRSRSHRPPANMPASSAGRVLM